MADGYEFYVQASVRGYHAYFVDATVYTEEVMDGEKVDCFFKQSFSIDLEPAFSCDETLLSCRQTLPSCYRTLLTCRQTLIRRQTLLSCRNYLSHFLVIAKPFLPFAKLSSVIAKPSLVVAISCHKTTS